MNNALSRKRTVHIVFGLCMGTPADYSTFSLASSTVSNNLNYTFGCLKFAVMIPNPNCRQEPKCYRRYSDECGVQETLGDIWVACVPQEIVIKVGTFAEAVVSPIVGDPVWVLDLMVVIAHHWWGSCCRSTTLFPVQWISIVPLWKTKSFLEESCIKMWLHLSKIFCVHVHKGKTMFATKILTNPKVKCTYRGRSNLWCQRFSVLCFEICTPSLFSPSPFCGANFKTKQALNLWHHEYLDPCTSSNIILH